MGHSVGMSTSGAHIIKQMSQLLPISFKQSKMIITWREYTADDQHANFNLLRVCVNTADHHRSAKMAHNA